MDDSPLWAIFVVAAIPAVAAVIGAVVAARSASKARAAQAEAERVHRLEERVAARKYDVYKPMIELLRDMLDPSVSATLDQQESMAKMVDFGSWIAIFGSDEAVLAYRNLMQAAYHDAPAEVHIHLYGNFLVAARRDMGDPNTAVSRADLMAIRIRDLYDEGDYNEAIMSSIDVLSAKHKWPIPWKGASAQLRDA